jgi:hypothetical protein
VEVHKATFDDRSEPDEQGFYEYIYVGANYALSEAGQTIVFRRYDDTPEAAALVDPIGWHPEVYTGALFRQAVAYLRDHVGVTRIKVLDPTPPGRGFVSLPEATAAAARHGFNVSGLEHLDPAT